MVSFIGYISDILSPTLVPQSWQSYKDFNTTISFNNMQLFYIDMNHSIKTSKAHYDIYA